MWWSGSRILLRESKVRPGKYRHNEYGSSIPSSIHLYLHAAEVNTRHAELGCGNPENHRSPYEREGFIEMSVRPNCDLTNADCRDLAFQSVSVKALCDKFRKSTLPLLGDNTFE
jgi:hypothetical protein